MGERIKVRGILSVKKPKPIGLARNLRRKESDAERKLWSKLRSRQFINLKFRRQHPIGKDIVDFVSLEKKIVVEVDGGNTMNRAIWKKMSKEQPGWKMKAIM